jgi:hypothetical protein
MLVGRVQAQLVNHARQELGRLLLLPVHVFHVRSALGPQSLVLPQAKSVSIVQAVLGHLCALLQGPLTVLLAQSVLLQRQSEVLLLLIVSLVQLEPFPQFRRLCLAFCVIQELGHQSRVQQLPQYALPVTSGPGRLLLLLLRVKRVRIVLPEHGPQALDSIPRLVVFNAHQPLGRLLLVLQPLKPVLVAIWAHGRQVALVPVVPVLLRIAETVRPAWGKNVTNAMQSGSMEANANISRIVITVFMVATGLSFAVWLQEIIGTLRQTNSMEQRCMGITQVAHCLLAPFRCHIHF